MPKFNLYNKITKGITYFLQKIQNTAANNDIDGQYCQREEIRLKYFNEILEVTMKRHYKRRTISYDGLNSLPEVLENSMDKFANFTAIVDDYVDYHLTYTQLKEEIKLFASGLQALGVKKGDKVALFAESNGSWLVNSTAILKCGAAEAIRGSNAPISELTYILDHADCKGMILRDSKLYNSLLPLLREKSFDFVIVTFPKGELDKEGVLSKVLTHKEVLELGKNNEFKPVDIRRGDDCSMIYTSGTTGNPKGVMLSHGNLIYQLEVVHEAILARPRENTLHVLPIWHSYERMGQAYYLSRGCCLHYTTLSGLRGNLVKYNINSMMSVPRIWAAIRTGIYQKLRQHSPLLHKFFAFAIKVSITYKAHKMYGERRITNKLSYNALSTLMHRIARTFIKPFHVLFVATLYKKIKRNSGLDTLRVVVSGGGSLSMQDELFYDAIGVDMRIAYGLTETAPVITIRSVQDPNFLGSAGTPVRGTDIKVVDPKTFKTMPKFKKGLVIAKGPGVMKGYYKDEAATKAVTTADRYFITGDLGWLTNENNLVLVGRIKETVVLSSGENIEPVPIEEAILLSPYIDQIVLVGQDRNSVGALVVPSKEALEKCGLNMQNIHSYKEGDFYDDKLEALIKKEIETHIENKPNLRVFEKVRQFALLNEPFNTENGLMTVSQKIKRNKIFDKYRDLISRMYNKK